MTDGLRWNQRYLLDHHVPEADSQNSPTKRQIGQVALVCSEQGGHGAGTWSGSNWPLGPLQRGFGTDRCLWPP